MSLFLHEITEISEPKPPRFSALAIVSLVIAVTGFLNIVGFVAGIVLGHAALIRFRLLRHRGMTMRGRWMAITALWVSYVALIVGALALLLLLVSAYMALQEPPPFHWRDHLHLPPLP